MLQQSTPFSPFVRQLVPFSQIAIGASYHKILRAICAAARNRNYVIDLIASPQGNAAVIALTALSNVLSSYVSKGVSSLNYTFLAPAIISSGTTLLSRLARVLLSISCYCIAVTLGIAGTGLCCFLALILSMSFVPSSVSFSCAVSTQRFNAVGTVLVFDQLIKRGISAADMANLGVGHSVSLSLHHIWASADGVIGRRSGATLADLYIIPQFEVIE